MMHVVSRDSWGNTVAKHVTLINLLWRTPKIKTKFTREKVGTKKIMQRGKN